MHIHRNLRIAGHDNKPILLDLFFESTGEKKPVIIFAHGFKGFKDWGTFDRIAEYFARAGFVYIKFNFSHNGTTVEQPAEFADLEAFGRNNFSIELDDLGKVIDWISHGPEAIPTREFDANSIYLIGHSRGGGIAILKAHEDTRIKKLVTWAAVSVFGRFWDEGTVGKWKENGVMYVRNARTGQDMPLYYQLYENLYAHADRLNIPKAASILAIPHLIVHGTADEAVAIDHAEDLHSRSAHSQLFIVENGGHTFGGKHPWEEANLPADLNAVLDATVEFLQNEKR